MELYLGHTDTLMGELDYTFMEAFDLNTVQRNDVDVTKIREKRFVTIRHRSVVRNGQVAWNGGIFHYEPTDIVAGPTSDA
jgi:hypothetical protein